MYTKYSDICKQFGIVLFVKLTVFLEDIFGLKIYTQ